MPATLAQPRSEPSRRHVVAGREIVLPEPGGTLTLRGVTWGEYLDINESPDSRGTRMTFDRGRLDIEMPGYEHETIGDIADKAIFCFARERGMRYVAAGSTRWDGPGSDQSLESDKSYYIGSADSVRGKHDIDLAVDPPPDLAIEIDISRPRPTRRGVHARLGVPELWQWRGGRLVALRLEQGRYVEVPQSVALPSFPLDVLADVLSRWPDVDSFEADDGMRQWCRDHPPQTGGGAVG